MNSHAWGGHSMTQPDACEISTRLYGPARTGSGLSSTQFLRTYGALCLTAPLISSVNAGWNLRVDLWRTDWAGTGAPQFIPMTSRGSWTSGAQPSRRVSRWRVKHGCDGRTGSIAGG